MNRWRWAVTNLPFVYGLQKQCVQTHWLRRCDLETQNTKNEEKQSAGFGGCLLDEDGIDLAFFGWSNWLGRSSFFSASFVEKIMFLASCPSFVSVVDQRPPKKVFQQQPLPQGLLLLLLLLLFKPPFLEQQQPPLPPGCCCCCSSPPRPRILIWVHLDLPGKKFLRGRPLSFI